MVCERQLTQVLPIWRCHENQAHRIFQRHDSRPKLSVRNANLRHVEIGGEQHTLLFKAIADCMTG